MYQQGLRLAYLSLSKNSGALRHCVIIEESLISLFSENQNDGAHIYTNICSRNMNNWIQSIEIVEYVYTSEIILGMGSANERRRYYVTPSLIGRAHTQNDLVWARPMRGGVTMQRLLSLAEPIPRMIRWRDGNVLARNGSSTSLAQPPLKFNGGLAKHGLTSLIK